MKLFTFFSLNRILQFVFLVFLAAIPLGTKKFIYNFPIFLGDKISIFLYLSDLLLLIFLIVGIFWILKIWKSGSGKFHTNILENVGMNVNITKRIFLCLILFVVLAGVSVFGAEERAISFYNFLRLVFLTIMAILTGILLRKNIINFERIVVVFAASAILQSFVAFFQFKFQHSLGLWFLGESFFMPWTNNVAKVMIEGGKLVRGYGTMPHSNILAGFLILGLICLYYLFLKTDSKLRIYPPKFCFAKFGRVNPNLQIYTNMFIVSGIFAVWLGLIVTFSRSGWIVAIASTLLFIAWGLWDKEYRKRVLELIVFLSLAACFLLLSFRWAIIPRLHLSVDEPSVNYRILYNKIGWETIKNNFWGVGAGNQVLYGMRNGLYEKFGMKNSWEFQPTHNLYILIAAEIGTLGLAAFLAFVLFLVISNWQSVIGKFSGSLEIITNYQLLISILLFGLFDHFSWDLWQGQLMLWVILGILMGISAHSSMDRVCPSEG